MMSIEQMLRQFWKKYPTYNLNALMRKRYEELMDARAFNEWLQNRQLKRQGEENADAMGRMAETVNHRISFGGPARNGGKCSEPRSSWPRASRQNMEEQRAFGFRVRPRFSEVLEYIEEGEPSFGIPLPNRNASIYRSSHFYLDEFPQSTHPLAENPRPHTQLGAAIENDFESADDGYQGRPFPQLQRPSFLQPGPDTDTEDEAYRRDGFDPSRPPDPGQPRSRPAQQQSQRARWRGCCSWAHEHPCCRRRWSGPSCAEWSNGCPRTQIIGRPTDAQRVMEQAGQRAQEIQRAAAQDIEQFAAEQAAAETADITPLLAETGAAAGEAAGVGALDLLGGAVGTVVAPEVAIPAAIGLAAGAGGALAAGVGRSEASTQKAQVVAGLQPLLAEHLKEQELALPPSQRPATWAELEGPLWAGLGPQRWAWTLAHTKARGTCWEATRAMAVRQIKCPTSERSTTCSKGPRSNRSA